MSKPRVGMLRLLLRWMHERQQIYQRRQAGAPPPWTTDPILRQYKACNVYREQDKVTRWIRENWQEPFATHPNLWFAMCIARHINWPPTLAEIGFPEEWNPRRVLRVMERRVARGQKVYSGAYLLGGGNREGLKKPRYTIMNVLNPVFRAVTTGKQTPPWEDGKHIEEVTLEAVHAWLLQFWGWGRFLAYETVTDLRHTRYLCNAPDIMTWANAGPGAQRGLNRIYGRELRSHHKADQLLDEMRTMEIRDIEMSLCELDKFCRAKERLAAGKIVGLDRYVPPGLV